MPLKHDPIEDTEQYKAIAGELEAKIVAAIGERSGMGYCHIYWGKKAEILKRDYNIDWNSPNVLNPGVRFD